MPNGEDSDRLPHPVTVTDFYLRAILDELRAQRPAGSSVSLPPETERVKEPQKRK